MKFDKTSGGKGVFFFKNMNDFIVYSNKNPIKQNYTIEEYIEGSGHGVSYFIRNKKIIFEFYDDEYYCRDKLAVVATSTPSSLRSNQKDKIRKFCLNYFKENNLKNGLFHIQCIKKNGEIYIIECTRRLPGDYYHQFATLSLGFSYLDVYLSGFFNSKIQLGFNQKGKKILRIVCDEKINSKISQSEWLQLKIKNNLIEKRKIDGFRISSSNKRFKKNEVIFLQFKRHIDSRLFCKKLFEGI